MKSAAIPTTSQRRARRHVRNHSPQPCGAAPTARIEPLEPRTLLSGDFAAAVTYPTGTGPTAIASADFNEDGHLDLAVANLGDLIGRVSILLGTGSGTFGPKVDYNIGNNPNCVVAGDFNEDGHIDLAVTNQSDNRLSVLLGTGTGAFLPKTDFVTGPFPMSVAVGDFNEDQHLDLAVVSFGGGTVSIFLGNGAGSFGLLGDYGTAVAPNCVAVADFNGDGHLDLAVTSLANNMVSVLLGRGNGTFAGKVDYPTGSCPQYVTSADLNGDGHADLAVVDYVGNTVSVLLGVGNGTFAARTSYPTGSAPIAVIAVDANQDGHLDLVVANFSGTTVSLLPGVGDGTFGPKADLTTGAAPQALLSADFNEDGQPDLAVVNHDASTVAILLHNDVTAPASSVSALPALLNAFSFTVTWSGSDTPLGTGLASYDIYVSDNGGEFTAWKTATTDTSAVFTGEAGHTYRFYSRAIDHAGNREAAPDEPDATITICPLQTVTLQGRNNKWTFLDADGTPVTVTYTGRIGSVVLEQWDDPDEHRGNLYAITVTGADLSCSLTITTVGTGAAALTEVEGILIHGSLGTLRGTTTSLAGDLTVTGGLGNLVLDDVSGQRTITIGPAPSAGKAVRMAFDQVRDLCIVSQMPIQSLTVAEWLDTDETPDVIGAPRLGTLTVAGRRAVASKGIAALAGNFQASLDLTGDGTLRTLGSATIAGSLAGCAWTIAGSVGTITVKGVTSDWTLGQQAAPVASVAGLGLGLVLDADAYVLNSVSTLRATTWMRGAVQAGSVKAMTIAGKLPLLLTSGPLGAELQAGFFGADLVLSGSGVTRGAILGAARIDGALAGDGWSISGKTGALTIGRLQAALDLPGANLTSIKTSSPLVRVLVDGVPSYLLAVGEGGEIYPIRFASLASWPKTVCDYSIASGDPEPAREEVLGAMALASVKNHMVSSGLGAWKGGAAVLKPGLVASYAKTTDPAYKSVATVAYVYDNSLAVLSLLAGTPAAEDQARAFQIADALVLLQDRDPANALAVADVEFPELVPAPLRDGYGAGTVAASRTASTVAVRTVGITTASSGTQAYAALALLRAGDVAEAAGDAARSADYRRTAQELLLYVARNREGSPPLEGFCLSDDPTIGTARATEHNVGLAAAFDKAAAAETDPARKAQWEAWRNAAQTFRGAMYGTNDRFAALAWIGDGWSYYRAGTDPDNVVNEDLVAIDTGAWSGLAFGDASSVAFNLIGFLATSTDASGRVYTGFDPGFRAVADPALAGARDGVGAEATAYMLLTAKALGDAAVLALLPDRAGLTAEEQTAYDALVAMADSGATDHDLADRLAAQLANMQLYAPNGDKLGLVAAAVRNVSTGEAGGVLINGWSLAATCWARLAYAGWNLFADDVVA